MKARPARRAFPFLLWLRGSSGVVGSEGWAATLKQEWQQAWRTSNSFALDLHAYAAQFRQTELRPPFADRRAKRARPAVQRMLLEAQRDRNVEAEGPHRRRSTRASG